MLSNKNNLRSELTANVGVLATTISITAWEWVLWENNMVACLEHYESGVCTKREVIKITAKSTDTFTITRWFADCIMNDNTKAQGHGSQTFSVGDYLSLYLSKEIWESLTTWISTNETAIQTMVARINAPRTCINNCCQSWKNAIDTAYVTRCGGNAGFGTGADGDCVITVADLDAQWYKYLCASCEYNFNNLTICPWVKVRFLWSGVPTINVWDKFINCGEIELKSWFVSNTCQTDCWLEKWCKICNQCTNWWACCGWQWWQFGVWVCWCNGCPWTASSWWYWWQWWNNGWAWSAPSGLNGWDGGYWACRKSVDGGWWWGGWWGGWWLYWNWWNGWSGWYTDCQTKWWTWWNGWNSGLFWKGWNGWQWWTTYWWNGWNGWNGWIGWTWWSWTKDENGWTGWMGVLCGGEWWSSRCWYAWNWWNAITNVYWFHLNARNIWNKCVDARGWNGWKWWCSPDYFAGNGWNGANGGQMIISYDCLYQQWCFDVRWWNAGCAWSGCRPWSAWSAWSAGWVVLKAVNYPYISNFTLESDGDNEAILISWRDPSIKQSASQQRAKTVVRYSTSNYPTTPTDWTLAVQETTKNQYESTPYSLTGVLDETTYYFSAFALDQNNTIIDVQSNSITTNFVFGGFQKVEYIENTSSSRINTWLKSWIWYKIDLKFYTSSSAVTDQTVVGWSTNTSAEAIYWWINYWSSYRSIYRWYNSQWFDANNTMYVWNTYTWTSIIRNGNQKVILNWNTVYSWTQSLSGMWNNNMSIFSRRWSNYARIKLYYMQIYDSSDNLIRDFRPVYRKSDNVIWLLDIVNKVFYTNVGGWTFVKWPNI